MNKTAEKVAILGASNDPEKFAHRAFQMLKEYGHTPIPVTLKFSEIEGVKAYSSLKDIHQKIDTVTMYVGPQTSAGMGEAIIKAAPRRVIFNPGSENPQLMTQLEAAGIETEEACTLVLLRTGQF